MEVQKSKLMDMVLVTVAGPMRDQIPTAAALLGHRIGVPDSGSSTAAEAAGRFLARLEAAAPKPIETAIRRIPGGPASALKDGVVDAFVSWGRVAEAGVPIAVPIDVEELLPIPATVTTLTKHEPAARAFVNFLTEDASRATFESAGALIAPEAGRRRAATELPIRLPSPRRQAGVATVGGRVLLAGGEAGGTWLDSLTWVNPSTYQVHDAVAKLNAPRAGLTAAHLAAAKGVYFFGGRTAEGLVATIERFDPVSDTMTTLSVTLPAPAAESASLVVGDRALLFGGLSATDEPTDAIVEFDPASSVAVTLQARLPQAVSGASAAPGQGGEVWIFGGRNRLGPLGDIAIFDPAAGRASRASVRLREPRAGVGVVPWEGGFLLVGGLGPRGLSDTAEVLRFDGTGEVLDARLPNGVAEAAVVRTGEFVQVLGGTTLARISSSIVRLPY